jgi:hypothetical protein
LQSGSGGNAGGGGGGGWVVVTAPTVTGTISVTKSPGTNAGPDFGGILNGTGGNGGSFGGGGGQVGSSAYGFIDVQPTDGRYTINGVLQP